MSTGRKSGLIRAPAGILLVAFFAAQPAYAASFQLNFPDYPLRGRPSLFPSHSQGLNYGNHASLAGIGVGSITNSLVSGVSVPSAYDPVTHQPIANSVIPWHTATGLEGLGYTLSTNLAPTLAGELAYYGIQRLGESVGLDPRISQLAGMPIKAGIGNIANPATRGQGIVNSMWEGLKSGATNLGINFLGEKADLDPLPTALAAQAITGAISGALKYNGNIVRGISENFTRSALTGLAFGGGADTSPVARATYLAKVNDFSNLVRDRGLGEALETYATSIFQRDAVETIFKRGGIADFLTGQAQMVELDGRQLAKIKIDDHTKIYLDPATDALMGREIGNILEVGTRYGLDDQGRFGLLDGKILTTDPTTGLTTTQTIRNGELIAVDFTGSGAPTEPVVTIRPLAGEAGVTFKDGNLHDGVLAERLTGTTYTIQDGRLTLSDAEIDDLLNQDPGFTQEVSLTNLTDKEESALYLYALEGDLDYLRGQRDVTDGADILGFSDVAKVLAYENLRFRQSAGTIPLRGLQGGESISDLLGFANNLSNAELQQATQALIANYTIGREGFDASVAPSIKGITPDPGSDSRPVNFVAALLPGIGVANAGWSEGIEKVLVNNMKWQKFELVWNTSSDKVGEGLLDRLTGHSGLFDYLLDSTKNTEIKKVVKAQLVEAQNRARELGIPFVIVGHSLGTEISYDILREDADKAIKDGTQPEFKVDFFVTTGTQLKFFGVKDLPQVDHWINVYNDSDVVNLIKEGIETPVLLPQIQISPLAFLFGTNTDVDLVPDPSGPLSVEVPGKIVNEIVTTPHTAMWSSVEILKAIEKHLKFDTDSN